MPRGGPQYTPAQMLEAGRRAEADGRIPHALGYYDQLATQHDRALEGAAAREALARLQEFTAEGALQGNGANGGRVPPPLPAAGGRFTRPMFLGRKSITIAPMETVLRVPLILPQPDRSYRVGRLIAWLLLAAGAAGVAGGMALLAGAWDARVLDLVPMERPRFLDGAAAGLGLVAGGVGLILAGELLRAFFAQARATRELAAIARARAEREAAEAGALPMHD